MSIINKPPQHVKREYELEEPVALVVEKYATFIDSTPDHVVNSALKIVLWRDRHFMNWRKQQQQAARKDAPPPPHKKHREKHDAKNPQLKEPCRIRLGGGHGYDPLFSGAFS